VTESDGALVAEPEFILPAVPVSAGAMIFDRHRRLLVLKPTYKSGWTIPGGIMEADGETPWQACQREVAEECGLRVTAARLACMDFRPSRDGKPGGIRYLFDCGPLDDSVLDGITLQAEEISAYRLVPETDALALLRKPIRRRVKAALQHRREARSGCLQTLYLEDGRPVSSVRQ
jgi:ADP-ribose pyrophosphatase YjhB (NUDIX family)